MTVNAVSGTYYYTSASQVVYFSSSISTERLNDLMKQFGVLQTGNADTDLKALFTAMYNYYSQSLNAANAQANSGATQGLSNNVPWAPLMQKVGLTATGNLNNDYAAFQEQVNLMEGNAKTTDAKDKLKQLEQQAGYLFVQGPTQSAPAAKKASGADILAVLNRSFMLS